MGVLVGLGSPGCLGRGVVGVMLVILLKIVQLRSITTTALCFIFIPGIFVLEFLIPLHHIILIWINWVDLIRLTCGVASGMCMLCLTSSIAVYRSTRYRLPSPVYTMQYLMYI